MAGIGEVERRRHYEESGNSQHFGSNANGRYT